MALTSSLEGKPWYYGLGVGLIVGLILVALGYYQFIAPMRKRIESQEVELARLQEDIQRGKAVAANLPQFRDEVNRLQLELEKLLRILPTGLNTDEILRNVRALAEQGDFKLKLFEPKKSLTDKGFYKEYPISITMDGDYHNLALFFDKLGRFPRIFNVDNLKMGALRNQKGSLQTLSASFIAKTFLYVEKSADELAEESAAGQGSGQQDARRGPQ